MGAKAEVYEFALKAFLEENEILRLYVPMHDALVLEEGKHLHKLKREVDDLFDGKVLAFVFDYLHEGFGAQLHDYSNFSLVSVVLVLRLNNIEFKYLEWGKGYLEDFGVC